MINQDEVKEVLRKHFPLANETVVDMAMCDICILSAKSDIKELKKELETQDD